MRAFFTDMKLPSFNELTGLAALEKEIQKFRELRDSYREANKVHYGEYLASILDD